MRQILFAALGEAEVVKAADVLGQELRDIVMQCKAGKVDPSASAPTLSELLLGKSRAHGSAVLFAGVLLLRIANASQGEGSGD